MATKDKIKKVGFRILKIFGWIWLGILILLLTVILVIQIPAVQQKIVSKATTFLEDKIGTTVSLGHFSLSFPKRIVLEDLYLEDQTRDTLLYAGRVSINTDLWALTKNKIQLNEIKIEDFTGNVQRSNDSVFNFDYIIEAFQDTTAVKDTTAASWDFAIYEANLNDFRFTFNDELEGNDVDFFLAELNVNIDEFDLNESVVQVDEILLAGVRANVSQRGSPPKKTTPADSVSESSEESQSFNIGFNTIELTDIDAFYEHDGSGQQVSLELGRFMVEADQISLQEQRIALDRVALEETFISYHQLRTEDSTTTSETTDSLSMAATAETSVPWVISLAELVLDDNSVQYYNFNEPVSEGIDFNHLWLTNLTVQAEDISFNNNAVAVILEQLTFRDRSGFGVKNMQANISLEQNQFNLEDFLLETFNSRFSMHARSQFASLDSLSSQLKEATITATVWESFIGLKDVMYFQPTITDSLPLILNPATKINIDLAVDGTVGNLAIANFHVAMLRSTELELGGSIKGLPEISQASMDITLDKLYTTANDIESVVQDTLIPQNIALPEWIKLTGRFSGTTETPDVRSVLATSFGDVRIDMAMDLDTVSSPPSYKGALAVNNFHVGRLLNQPDTIGRLSMDLAVNGEGFAMEDLNTALKLTVNSFEYRGYEYNDLIVDGAIKEYLFSGKAVMEDSNLSFSLEGDLDYNYNKEQPQYHFSFDLKNADFHALNLSSGPMKAKGKLVVEMDNANPDDLNGSFDIREVAIFNGEKLYRVDSLLFASVDQEGRSEISIKSDIVEGEFKGSFNLFTLPGVLKQYFHTYYTLHDTTRASTMEPQQFTFHLDLKNTALLTDVLMPDLETFVPGTIEGEFDSRSRELRISVNIQELQHTSFGAQNIQLDIEGNENTLEYSFTSEAIEASVVNIPSLSIEGDVGNNVINTTLTIYDSLEEQRFLLGGIFRSVEDAYRFTFEPDKVVLNYRPWDVPESNFIQFGGGGLVANNFQLTSGNERISLETITSPDSTMILSLQQLDLRSLTTMASAKDTLMSGEVNGEVRIVTEGSGGLEAGLTIDQLAMKNTVVGDLKINAAQRDANRYKLDLSLDGIGTETMISGFYTTTETGTELDINADIESLNMARLEPLLFGAVRDMSGRVTGSLSIKGELSAPDITGDLTFQDVVGVPDYLNTRLKIADETIRFTNSGISFGDFQITDERNNPIRISGNINTENFRKLGLDLNIFAEDFLMLNTTAEDNDMFFGTVILNTRTRVSGTSQLPIINMQVSLGEGTEFTYVTPQPESGVLEQEGIVRWVDKDAAEDPFLASIQRDRKVTADTVSAFTGMNLSANIELDEEEKFNIVIDPLTGDQLAVRGNATLTLNIDPTGDMSLTGRYEVVEGQYNLSFYNLVKREFGLRRGSTITWSGDPMNATVDLTAVYQVETSPIELVSNTMQGSSAEQLNRYKQRIPFLVYLNIGGELMTPEISFELEMPMEARSNYENVYAIIQDINTRESDLNKQVFALLILKRFISDNPFESQAGGSLEGTARRSVSKILTEQLNRLSDDIEGLELTFDVKSYEDYSSGEAENNTALELGLSKNLLNDRLVVKLSGNVNIEGQQNQQESFTDYIGDLALEYLLTEDGRFRITGFQNSDYSMIDGELRETGVGLIYIKDYNTLRQLFQPNEETQQKN